MRARLCDLNDFLFVPAGIDKHCAKVLFAFSQCTVVDELKRRQRAVSLHFYDFLEALARLSEVLSPPTAAELAAFGKPQQLVQLEQKQQQQQQQDSVSLPLSVSLTLTSQDPQSNLDDIPGELPVCKPLVRLGRGYCPLLTVL